MPNDFWQFFGIPIAILVSVCIFGAPIIVALGFVRMVAFLFKTGQEASRRQKRANEFQPPPEVIKTRAAEPQPNFLKRPYFEALGLDDTATPGEVLAAYRQLAFDLHPDRGGDPDEFKKLHGNFEKAMAYAERLVRKPR